MIAAGLPGLHVAAIDFARGEPNAITSLHRTALTMAARELKFSGEARMRTSIEMLLDAATSSEWTRGPSFQLRAAATDFARCSTPGAHFELRRLALLVAAAALEPHARTRDAVILLQQLADDRSGGCSCDDPRCGDRGAQ